MRRHRYLGVVVLSVFLTAIAAPVFAGGTDVPIIPPKRDPQASFRMLEIARIGTFIQIMSVIWGGGR